MTHEETGLQRVRHSRMVIVMGKLVKAVNVCSLSVVSAFFSVRGSCHVSDVGSLRGRLEHRERELLSCAAGCERTSECSVEQNVDREGRCTEACASECLGSDCWRFRAAGRGRNRGNC